MDIPDTINNKFKELKESFPFHIVLKRLNGTYYVYRQTSTWVKELKKPKTEAEYLGKINNDGTFIKKLKEKEDEIRNAKEIIEAHGGKVFLPEVKNPIKITKSTDIERKILKILSMNGRASYSFIGKLTGLTASAAYNRVKILEKKYDISYIPEIDAQKLGYLSYIVFIKLIDNKLPPVKELKNVLENEPRIQLAITTTGDYDLILFFLAKDNRDVNLILLDIQSKSVFKDYAMKWNITPNFDAYCFIPFREKFLELLGYENSYGSVSLKVKNANISEREKKVLKELNKDGRMSFTAIDRKYSLNHGASQYAYYSLVKKNILRRITITETNLQIKYNVIFLSQIIYGGIASSTRTSLLLDIYEDTTTSTTKYAYASNIGVPIGGFLVLPIFKDDELQTYAEKLVNGVKGIDLRTLIITNILIGSFCYRKFDNTYSRQYRLLVEESRVLEPVKIISYNNINDNK